MEEEKKVNNPTPSSQTFDTVSPSFFEGEDKYSWKYFGHHAKKVNGEDGFVFRVWAPNAQNVYLVGSFTEWWKDEIQMQRLEHGIWECWTPLAKPGDLYKFKVKQVNGQEAMKSDPFGRTFEKSPNLANVVISQKEKTWKDDAWMETQGNHEANNIYYAKIDEWKCHEYGVPYTLKELEKELIPYLKEMNYTHLLFKSLIAFNEKEENTDSSLGLFAFEESYGTIEDFQHFVEACHLEGIGVMMDVNISQFSMEDGTLSYYDGTPQFEYLDRNRARVFKYQRKNFDLGKPEVRSYLISSIIYWIETFHLDGFRFPFATSMVSRDKDGGPWSPNINGGRKNLEGIEFLQKLDAAIFEVAPHVKVMGVEDTERIKVTGMLSHGGLGLDWKENDNWQGNTLKFYNMDPIYRKYQFNLLLEAVVGMYDEHYINPLLTTITDDDDCEQGVFSLIWGNEPWKKFAQLRNLMVYHKALPGAKIQQMGVEIANETNFGTPLHWENLWEKKVIGLQKFVKDLNALYKETPSMWVKDYNADGFDMVDFENKNQSIFSFIRNGETPLDFVLVVLNMTPVEHPEFHIGVPYWGEYEEILNTEMHEYGGNWKVGNENIHSLPYQFNHLPFQIHVSLPAFGALIIKPKAVVEEASETILKGLQSPELAQETLQDLEQKGFHK